MEEVKLGYHDLLFKEGDKANKVFIVKSGEVLCMKFAKDRLFPIFLAKEGDIIGESAILSQNYYSYSAISLSFAELVSVNSFSFKQIFSSAPNWMHNMMTTMLARLDFTSNLISENRIYQDSIIGLDRFSEQIEIEFKNKIFEN